MKRWKMRVGFVAGGSLLGALAAEIVARTVSATPGEELLFRAPQGSLRGLYQPDPVLLNVPVPGFSGTVSAPGYSVDVTITSEGVRAAPPASGDRWLAIGDSFTLSAQADADETFAARLSEKLGVDVLNAGVDGYSTWQSTERYRRLDEAVGSKRVLLTYFLGNDLTDDEVYPNLVRRPGPGNAPAPGPTIVHEPPGLGLVQTLLFRYSRVYAYVRVAAARRALSDKNDPEIQKFKNELVPFTRAGAGRLQQLASNSERALQALRDAAAQNGDSLVVAVAPPAFAVDAERAAATLATFGLTDPDVDAPGRAVLAALDRLGIVACDLKPALSPASYLRFDGHWTPAGHAAVAERIAGCLSG